jgi:hypothetical protein
LLPLGLLLSSSACTSIKQTRTEADGTRFSVSAVTIFQKSALSKLDADSKTAQTYHGLKIGTFDSETQNDSLKAAGEAFGTAVGAALKKSLIPAP